MKNEGQQRTTGAFLLCLSKVRFYATASPSPNSELDFEKVKHRRRMGKDNKILQDMNGAMI